jgi:hypothetical protein
LIRAEYNMNKIVDNDHLMLPASKETPIQLPRTYAGPDALTKLLSDSIDEALTDLVGTRAREAIYDCVERNHSIARIEIPNHLEELFSLFEHHFGPASAQVIGRVIAKKAYSKLDWEFRPIPKFEFNDYM